MLKNLSNLRENSIDSGPDVPLNTTQKPIFLAMLTNINLHVSHAFYISIKGKFKAKWSGEYGSPNGLELAGTRIINAQIDDFIRIC